VALLVPALSVTKVADTTRIVAGGRVGYTLRATNTGAADYPGVTLTDDLSGVLDDAAAPTDAAASTGALSLTGSTLSWTGPLARGASVVVTYSVRVQDRPAGDSRLVNVVHSDAVGSSCPSAGGAATCATSTEVDASTLSLTGLTPSFTLTGPVDSTVQRDDAVTMTVSTNSYGGYSVAVLPTDDRLRSPRSTDTVPIGALAVRTSGTLPFAPLAAGQSTTVHQQDRPSAAGGDAVSNDYQVQIPFVDSETYSTTLDYIVTAR
jgi:uncharacterized repeat protein (TIGR01451 family)